LQEQLFAVALAELAEMEDLVNQALEISLSDDGEAVIEVYESPKVV